MVPHHPLRNIRVYQLALTVYSGIVLFGYDTGIAGGIVSQPYFQTHFLLINADGSPDKKKLDEVSSNVVSILQGGAFFGSLSSAFVSSSLTRIGRRKTLILYCSIFILGAVLTTLATGPQTGLQLIYAGRFISGVGIGAISAVAPAFVSECSPKDVRGRITGLFQIMVAAGVMISYFINFFVGLHMGNSPNVWRVPFACQLVPAGMMLFGLLTVKESPRWLASVGRHDEAFQNLVYFRRTDDLSDEVILEMAEIDTAIEVERMTRQDAGIKEAFVGKGNLIRFCIAFVIFLLQQWAGQNSINYYAPQVFASIGYVGSKNSLLASGIYGVVKVLATTLFVFAFADSLGRKICLLVSAIGMSLMFFILGAVLKMHPSTVQSGPVIYGTPTTASRGMAGLLYVFVCFYSMGWGPLPWVYVSEIFAMRNRDYGLSFASSSQWLWNFVVSKLTPRMITSLGYKVFFIFAIVNGIGNTAFSLLIPETKGRSLEDMDVIFGRRGVDIEPEEKVRSMSQSFHPSLAVSP